MRVDDPPVFLEVARALVGVTPGFEAVGEARSGREAPELVAAVEGGPRDLQQHIAAAIAHEYPPRRRR